MSCPFNRVFWVLELNNIIDLFEDMPIIHIKILSTFTMATQKSKTNMCKNFPRCKFGEKCHYNHPKDVQKCCNECMRNGYHSNCFHCGGNNIETIECEYFATDKGCTNIYCKFVHVNKMPLVGICDLRMFDVCKFYKTPKGCKNGSACIYIHRE